MEDWGHVAIGANAQVQVKDFLVQCRESNPLVDAIQKTWQYAFPPLHSSPDSTTGRNIENLAKSRVVKNPAGLFFVSPLLRGTWLAPLPNALLGAVHRQLLRDSSFAFPNGHCGQRVGCLAPH